MSQWSYVSGIVVVEPMGRTQPEKRYILDTVLAHLPVVTGSEKDMDVYVVQKAGHNSSSSHDEFGDMTNNLTDDYGDKSRYRGWLRTQREYILVVDGSLRDRTFAETKEEFMKWLCRLAKRVRVNEVLVSVSSYDGQMLIQEDEKFGKMFEDPSWAKDNPDHEPAWCEYMMWDRARNTDLPLKLAYKYYADPEIDAEFERRHKYEFGKEEN